MQFNNQTFVTEFILLGFPGSRTTEIAYFVVFLIIYIFTIIANGIIITLVITDLCLHNPMYFFLANFAFLEVWYSTTTVPKMLSNFLTENKVISYRNCIAQLCSIFTFGLTEFLLLAVMAYDRYVAICYPLRYSTIMNSRFCKQVVIASWATGFLTGWTLTIPLIQLSFCRLNQINHFFCDFVPLLKLACSDTMATEISFTIAAYVVVLSSLVFTVVSYCYIILTILRIPSNSGRQKAFSTCSSHLTVAVIFYGTVIFTYLRPNSTHHLEIDKVVSLFYSVITPLINPLIYTLRNKIVIRSLKRAWGKIC